MPFLLFAIFFIIVIILGVHGAAQAAKRRDELRKWAAHHNLRFNEGSDYYYDEAFPEFDALQHGSNRYAYNISTGYWQNRPLYAFDYHYETTSRDSDGNTDTTHHHFSAVIISTDFPLKPLDIRPEGFLDRISQFFGFDDIDFESAEFSKRFHVKSPDRKWAYDVITQQTMQFMLKAPQYTIQFAQNHIIVTTGGTFSPHEFHTAAHYITQLINNMPDYLVKQQKQLTPSR